MKRAVTMASWLFGLLSGTGIITLILLTATDVSWRNLTGRSLPGAFEYTEVILVATVFLSLAWTQRIDGHVSVDLVTRALRPSLRHAIQAAGLMVAILVLGWMAVASGHAAWASFLSGEYRIGLTRVPVWPARAAVSLGTALLVLQLAVHCVKETRLMLKGGDDPSGDDQLPSINAM